jgi:hypothetical protein
LISNKREEEQGKLFHIQDQNVLLQVAWFKALMNIFKKEKKYNIKIVIEDERD